MDVKGWTKKYLNSMDNYFIVTYFEHYTSNLILRGHLTCQMTIQTSMWFFFCFVFLKTAIGFH